MAMRNGSSATGYERIKLNKEWMTAKIMNSPHRLGRSTAPSRDAPTPPQRISAYTDWRWASCPTGRAPLRQLAGRACSTGPSAWTAATASSCAPSRWLCSPGLPAKASPTRPGCDSTGPSSACRGRLADCSASRRECSPQTRCRLTSCSPWNWAWFPVRGTIGWRRTLLRSRCDRARDRRHVRDQNHKSKGIRGGLVRKRTGCVSRLGTDL